MYDGNLNSEGYLNFLRTDLWNYIEDVPLNILQQLWWQQDGAPPHNALRVRSYLDEVFTNKWIGNRGVVEWPPRSPDLSPLDFFLWGLVKNKLYKNNPENANQLRENIVAAFNEIPGRTIQRDIKNIRKRGQLCVEANGVLFEHLL